MRNGSLAPASGQPVYKTVRTSRLYEQIVQQIEESILKGALKPGDQVRIRLSRDGTHSTVTATLGALTS